MPNNPAGSNIPRLFMQKWTPEFQQVDYMINLNGPFDMNVHLQSLQAEAEAKDMCVLIQVSLVPTKTFYGPFDTEVTNESPEPEQPV